MSRPKSPSVIPAILVFIVTFLIFSVLFGGAVCSDGWGSRSIGRTGACSHHGGVSKWPSVIAFIASAFIAFIFHEFRSKNRAKEESTASAVTQKAYTGTQARNPTNAFPFSPAPISAKPAKKPRASYTKCPRCRSEMVLRTAQRGKNAGSQFWGCGKYPRCRGTRACKEDEAVSEA